MRRWSAVFLITAITACDRFEAPRYAQEQTLKVHAEQLGRQARQEVFLIQDTRPRDAGPYLAVFQGGRLLMQEGCIYMDQALVVWPRETRLDLSDPERIGVVDRGRTASVGEYVSVTGHPWPGELIGAPEDCARSSAFVVSSFEPMSPAEWDRLMSPPPPPPRPESPNSRPRRRPTEGG